MPRVLLLATTTGYQTRAFGDAASKLGVELMLATDRCDMLDDPWRDGAVPIRFHDEPRSAAAILAATDARPIDGVLVVGDRPTIIAARVSEALGLAGHAPAATEVARNKRMTRERLRDAGLAVPWFHCADIDADAGALARMVPFPCVIKPIALSGSRGVMRADTPEAFANAFERLRALLRSPDVKGERDAVHETILVESFIPGREFALEGLMHDGDLQVLAIFDKPDPLDGPFFEETIYLTPTSLGEESKAAIVAAVTRAAHVIGLSHGPVHAECRVNDRGVFVLEVAARPIGGLCSRVLRFRRNDESSPDAITLEELLLRHAIGERASAWRRESLAAGVMMMPIPSRGTYRGVTGVDEARAVRHVEDVRITAKTDQLLVPLPEGASYLGFIFARGGDVRTVDRALREAHARLRFRIDPELCIVRPR